MFTVSRLPAMMLMFAPLGVLACDMPDEVNSGIPVVDTMASTSDASGLSDRRAPPEEVEVPADEMKDRREQPGREQNAQWYPSYAMSAIFKKTWCTELRVANTEAVLRLDEPARGGVIFPRGVVRQPGDLHLIEDSQVRAVQVSPLGIAWPDGSLKRALVQYKTTVKPGSLTAPTVRTALLCTGARYVGPSSLFVKDTGGSVWVDTGPMQFEVVRGNALLPNLVRVNGRLVSDGIAAHLIAYREAIDLVWNSNRNDGRPEAAPELQRFGVGDEQFRSIWGPTRSDRSAGLRNLSVEVEEAGPIRVVLRLSTPRSETPGNLGVVARIYAYAGETSIRTEFTLVSEERLEERGRWGERGERTGTPAVIANSHLIESLTIDVKRPGTLVPERVVHGRASGSEQVSGAVPSAVSADPQRSEPGWMQAQWSDGVRVTLAAQAFGDIWPKRMSHAAGVLRYEVWPVGGAGPQMPLNPIPAGRARTWEWVVDFGGGLAEEVSAMARQQLHVFQAAESASWDEDLFPFVAFDGSYPRHEAMAARNHSRHEAGAMLRGEMDYGDHPYNAANERYNACRGPAQQTYAKFRASGDRRYLSTAQAMVRHAMNVDMVNWAPRHETARGGPGRVLFERWGVGARDGFGATHRAHLTLAHSSGTIYFWLNDLVMHYFLTGDRRVVDILRQIPEHPGFHRTDAKGNPLPFVLSADRASAIPALNLMYLFEVVGNEASVGLVEPTAVYTAPAYARTDSLSVADSQRALSGARTMMRYLGGELDGAGGMISLDVAGLDPLPGSPDLLRSPSNTPAPPRNLYTQSSFQPGYASEALYHYWRVTRSWSAGLATLRFGDFADQLKLPTGTTSYARNVVNMSVNSRWMPVSTETLATPTFGELVAFDGQRLTKGLVDYHSLLFADRFGDAMLGRNRDIPAFVHAMRSLGLTEDDAVRAAAAAPGIDTTAAWIRTRSSWNGSELRPGCMLAIDVGRAIWARDGARAGLVYLHRRDTTGTLSLPGQCAAEFVFISVSMCESLTAAERERSAWPVADYPVLPCP